MMCHDLSAELAQFDLQKEKEFKQMLLDYAAAQLEKHEKVSSSLVFLLDFHHSGLGLGRRLSFITDNTNSSSIFQVSHIPSFHSE